MAKKAKKIVSISMIAVLAAALVALIALRVVGFQFRAVKSPSMEPDLPVGSLVVVKNKPLSEMKVGDDVTFVRDKNLTVVTHRIVSIDLAEESIITHGIANNTIDAPVSYDNVIGTVRLTVPYVGYFLLLLATTRGKIIAITVIISLIIIWFIIDALIRRRRPEEKQEQDETQQSDGLGSWLSSEDDASSDDL